MIKIRYRRTSIALKLVYLFSKKYPDCYFRFGFWDKTNFVMCQEGIKFYSIRDIIPSVQYEYIEFNIKRSRLFYYDSRGFSTCYLRLLNSTKEKQNHEN